MDTLELLKSVLNTLGVELKRISDVYTDIEDFDGGIRRQLFEGYKSDKIAEQIVQRCEDSTIYIAADQFELNYILFKYEAKYIFIGPYILAGEGVSAVEIARKLNIPLFHVQLLQKYLYTIPVVMNMEPIVFLFVEKMFGKGLFRIERNEQFFKEDYDNWEIQIEADDPFYMELMEERYQREERLMEAIMQGDVTKANLVYADMNEYPIPHRAEDSMRDMKNMCLTNNVLCRKAVQRAKVHPVYIDELSSVFVKRIEHCNNALELKTLFQEMTRKYCMLVQNYSMKEYSEVIARILNYIDFHIADSLSLKNIAGIFNLNPSYLSRLFKKETGKTMTDYINERRVEKSLIFLTTTNISIQAIAARVGIFDENYFSRVFKKIKNMSPREYRNSVKNRL